MPSRDRPVGERSRHVLRHGLRGKTQKIAGPCQRSFIQKNVNRFRRISEDSIQGKSRWTPRGISKNPSNPKFVRGGRDRQKGVGRTLFFIQIDEGADPSRLFQDFLFFSLILGGSVLRAELAQFDFSGSLTGQLAVAFNPWHSCSEIFQVTKQGRECLTSGGKEPCQDCAG